MGVLIPHPSTSEVSVEDQRLCKCMEYGVDILTSTENTIREVTDTVAIRKPVLLLPRWGVLDQYRNTFADTHPWAFMEPLEWGKTPREDLLSPKLPTVLWRSQRPQGIQERKLMFCESRDSPTQGTQGNADLCLTPGPGLFCTASLGEIV